MSMLIVSFFPIMILYIHIRNNPKGEVCGNKVWVKWDKTKNIGGIKMTNKINGLNLIEGIEQQQEKEAKNKLSTNGIIFTLLTALMNGEHPVHSDYTGISKDEFDQAVEIMVDDRLVKNGRAERGGIGNKIAFATIQNAAVTSKGIAFVEEYKKDKNSISFTLDELKQHNNEVEQIFINHLKNLEFDHVDMKKIALSMDEEELEYFITELKKSKDITNGGN